MASSMTFEFLDVGMGDGTLVKLHVDGEGHDRLILVDFGEKRSQFKVPYEDALEYLVSEINDNSLARRKDVPFVDVLVITHPDGDHYNKIAELVDAEYPDYDDEQLQFGEIFYSGRPREYGDLITDTLDGLVEDGLDEMADNYHCDVGMDGTLDADWRFGEISVFILSANWPHIYSATNPKSVVLMFDLDGRSVILGGDETTATERHILDEVVDLEPSVLRSVGLKMGHHGSKGSSSQEWIDAVQPDGIFASGDFAWSHPYCEAICRFVDSGYLIDHFARDAYYCCGDSGSYYNNARTLIVCMNLWFTVLRWRTETVRDEETRRDVAAGFLTTYGVQWELVIRRGAAIQVNRTDSVIPARAPRAWDCDALAVEQLDRGCAMTPPPNVPLLLPAVPQPAARA